MLNIIRLRYLILILMLGFISPGCSLLHKSSRQKSEKKVELQKEKNKKFYDTGLKQQHKVQSKQTLKMMKQSKRQAAKLNRGKQRNHSRKHC